MRRKYLYQVGRVYTHPWPLSSQRYMKESKVIDGWRGEF
jgi:hypothetical protein